MPSIRVQRTGLGRKACGTYISSSFSPLERLLYKENTMQQDHREPTSSSKHFNFSLILIDFAENQSLQLRYYAA
jgi:hypothetical protein